MSLCALAQDPPKTSAYIAVQILVFMPACLLEVLEPTAKGLVEVCDDLSKAFAMLARGFLAHGGFHLSQRLAGNKTVKLFFPVLIGMPAVSIPEE